MSENKKINKNKSASPPESTAPVSDASGKNTSGGMSRLFKFEETQKNEMAQKK